MKKAFGGGFKIVFNPVPKFLTIFGEIMRKLASIQKIKFIKEIKNADKIELGIINGWQSIVKKGEFKKGDKVLFFEIDSFLNSLDKRFRAFEDRFCNWQGKIGLRVKTIKLRNEISQGIIMPIWDFKELDDLDLEEGLDVTEILGIEKWEPVQKTFNGSGGISGRTFPSFIPKTDQQRVQNIVASLPSLLDRVFEVTVKKDGSSMTVFKLLPSSKYYEAVGELKDYQEAYQRREPFYGICSRNVWLKLEGDSNFHKGAKAVLDTLNIDSISESIAIQGELLAPDIQGNYENVDKIEYQVFDIFAIDKQKYFTPYERQDFCNALHVSHVTHLSYQTLKEFLSLRKEEIDEYKILEAILNSASGKSDNEAVMREGIVLKSEDGKLSFKAVSNEYLIKTGK